MKFTNQSLTELDMRWSLSEAAFKGSALYECLMPALALPVLEELAKPFTTKFTFKIVLRGIEITKIERKIK